MDNEPISLITKILTNPQYIQKIMTVVDEFKATLAPENDVFEVTTLLLIYAELIVAETYRSKMVENNLHLNEELSWSVWHKELRNKLIATLKLYNKLTDEEIKYIGDTNVVNDVSLIIRRALSKKRAELRDGLTYAAMLTDKEKEE